MNGVPPVPISVGLAERGNRVRIYDILNQAGSQGVNPYTDMAEEIFHQLETNVLANAANLTDHAQVLSLCKWLIHL